MLALALQDHCHSFRLVERQLLRGGEQVAAPRRAVGERGEHRLPPQRAALPVEILAHLEGVPGDGCSRRKWNGPVGLSRELRVFLSGI